jgi:hypothetical protein
MRRIPIIAALLIAGLSAWGQDTPLPGDPNQTWNLTSCTTVGHSTRLTVKGPSWMTLWYKDSAEDGCGSYAMGDTFVRIQLPLDWGGAQVACPLYMYSDWKEELPHSFEHRENKANFDWWCARIVSERVR